MGQAVTDIYDEKAIDEEYGVTPQELIQVKALQGDTSDNIPGVAGVGAKTALDLIFRFHNLDYIYDNLDELDIKPGVKAKLKNDKEKAYLSLKLGTISTEAPIDTDINSYVIKLVIKALFVCQPLPEGLALAALALLRHTSAQASGHAVAATI